jgi:DNA-binding GntR family transcriptional regulator
MLRALDGTNAAASAYQEIKRRIVEVEYVPGEKLSESLLMLQLGMGRSPIRTALARLHNEGWISVSPQSGTFVKALTSEAIEQLTELRLLLELHAASAAATKITQGNLKRLRRSFEILSPLIRAGDVEAFIQLDKDLHSTIYDAAGNDLIAEILLDLRDKIQWIRRACSVSLDRMLDGFEELVAVMQALELRNPETAANRMRIHIANAAAFCCGVDMADVSKALKRRQHQHSFKQSVACVGETSSAREG